ncbi:hypothetical protein [Nocardia sp. X0981]
MGETGHRSRQQPRPPAHQHLLPPLIGQLPQEEFLEIARPADIAELAARMGLALSTPLLVAMSTLTPEERAGFRAGLRAWAHEIRNWRTSPMTMSDRSSAEDPRARRP